MTCVGAKFPLPLRTRRINAANSAFSSESLPRIDPGWRPVRIKKTRQIKI
jgi:hypothetical protein